MKIGGTLWYTHQFGECRFDYFKVGISFPMLYKKEDIYEFYAEATKNIGIEMPTSIGFERSCSFWSFDFCILGFGIKLLRQKSY